MLWLILCFGGLSNLQAQSAEFAFNIRQAAGAKITHDNNGHVYVTGTYSTANGDLDPGTGTTNLANNGLNDVFVTKYTTSGELVWAFGIGDNTANKVTDIAVDASGNVYIAGSYTSSSLDFDPGAGTSTPTFTGGTDAYIAKYNSSGTFQWVKTIQGSGNDQANALAIDASGNIYVTGHFQGTNVDFDPGAGTAHLSSTGDYDIFIAKYDTNGAYQWAHGLGNSNDEEGFDIVLDASNNVYVTGVFNGTIDFDPGVSTASITTADYSTFLAKYNSTGAYQWAFHVANSGGLSIGIDTNSDVYIAGYLVGSADFDPGAGTATLAVLGFGSDMYVAKYSSAGAYQWAFKTSSSSNNNLAIDNNNNVYITGHFSGSNIDFDPGSGTERLSSSGEDAFVAKYSSAGAYQWAYKAGNSGNDQGMGITVNNDQLMFITGQISQGTSNFGFGGTAKNLTVNTGEEDAYVAGYCQGAPGTTSTITGTANICAGQTGVTYTIPAITGATGYTWDVPTGVTITAGDNTNSITVNFSNSASSGDIDVTPKNGCGNGTMASLTVTINSLVGNAGTISGLPSVCANQTGVIYTVPAIGNATNYTWTLPAGAAITAGANTNSITVNFGTTGGNIMVQGSNACGSGNVSADFPVTVNTSLTPTASISATATSIYEGTEVTFSASVTNEGVAPSYQWYVNGTAVSGATAATFTKNDFSSGDKVTLELASSFSCATASKVTSNELTISVLPQNTPPALLNSFNLERIYPEALTTDKDGNLYVTGSFDGTHDFDPGSGTANITSKGTADMFVAKYDANGTYQWAFGVGGTRTFGYSIAVDKNGNIYVTGAFYLTADFDPGPGTANLTTQHINAFNVFFAKYDNNGNYLWAKSIGGPTLDSDGQKILVDDAGSIYLAGSFESSSINMNPGGSAAVLTNINPGHMSHDFFVAKYDTDGEYQWAFRVGGTGRDVVNDLVLDNNNDIYVTGFFAGTNVDFDPGTGVANMTGTKLQFYIAKYSNNGAYVWSYSFDDNAFNGGAGLVVDSQNNVYVTGILGKGASVDADPGVGVATLTNQGSSLNDGFIAKYAADGTYQWAFTIPDYTINSPALDDHDNLYIVGHLLKANSVIDFDPGNTLSGLISSGGTDVVLAKYKNNGDFQWAKNIEGTDNDYSQDIHIPAGTNNIYIAGYFESTSIDTDLGTGVNALNRLDGTSDGFIAKYQLVPETNQTISGATSVCVNQTGVTYTIPAITGATGYTWTVPAGANISAGAGTNSITVIFGSTSGNITVKGTNSAGDGAVTTLAVTVNALVTPTLSISASANTICAGSPVTFTATATHGGTNPVFEWRLNSTKIEGETGATLTKSDLKNGDKVTVILTSSEACVTTSTATTNELNIIVNEVFTPSVSITSDDADNNIVAGANVTFTATSTNGGSNPTYQWQINGVDVPGANASSFITATLQNADKVTVVMASSETCVSSAQVTSNEITMSVGDVLTSIGGQLTNAELRVYPNPAIEKASLYVQGKSITQVQVDIYDAMGRKVATQQGALANKTFEFEVGQLAEGRYVLKIHLGNKVITRSLVKQ
ncbi:hypothetical protein BKI52_11905 [marine bacterium AO1-C]|nr:hypothetical protein BKI52_11905 [marine bacterium AO1-C]